MLVALTGGKVYTITGGILDDATVLIRDGKIEQVGSVDIPEGATVIDASAKLVFPGFIDAHAHLALHEEGLGWEGNDVNEASDPVTAHVRAIDGINPADEGIKDAIAGGITAAWVAPGSANVIGGEGVTIKLDGDTVDDMVIKASSGLKAAFGENPKRVYSQKKTMPSTRMGVAAVLRDALNRGRNYLKKMEKAEKDGDDAFERDLKLEPIARVLKGEMPLRLHAHRADDIVTALRIADEFEITLVIEHCTEGHRVASQLASRNVTAVVGPTLTARRKVELRERNLGTPAEMHRHGVKFALTTDHPVIPIQYLTLTAAMAVREGLPEEEALKAITLNAADIAGVGDRIGSIEPGKDADLVVWNGHPLDLRSRAETVLINGRVVHTHEQ